MTIMFLFIIAKLAAIFQLYIKKQGTASGWAFIGFCTNHLPPTFTASHSDQPKVSTSPIISKSSVGTAGCRIPSKSENSCSSLTIFLRLPAHHLFGTQHKNRAASLCAAVDMSVDLDNEGADRSVKKRRTSRTSMELSGGDGELASFERFALDRVEDAVLLIEGGDTILFVNNSFARMMHVDKEAVVGSHSLNFLSSSAELLFFQLTTQCMKDQLEIQQQFSCRINRQHVEHLVTFSPFDGRRACCVFKKLSSPAPPPPTLSLTEQEEMKWLQVFFIFLHSCIYNNYKRDYHRPPQHSRAHNLTDVLTCTKTLHLSAAIAAFGSARCFHDNMLNFFYERCFFDRPSTIRRE